MPPRGTRPLHSTRCNSPSFDPACCGCYYQGAGWSSPVARWAHNPKVAGSNPAPATNSHSFQLRPQKNSLPLLSRPVRSCHPRSCSRIPSCPPDPATIAATMILVSRVRRVLPQTPKEHSRTLPTHGPQFTFLCNQPTNLRRDIQLIGRPSRQVKNLRAAGFGNRALAAELEAVRRSSFVEKGYGSWEGD